VVGNWSVARAGWPLLEEKHMRITPLDVRKQEFKRGMRGYDADEVRAFLVNLADEYEAVLVDNKQLRERLVEQDEKLAEYRNLERTLRDTLMTAEKVTQEARENARREGELLLAEARQRVEKVLQEGRQRLNDLRREALDVHREKEAYLGRFRSFAEAQIQFVEQHRGDFKELDGRLLDQMDLTAVTPSNQSRTSASAAQIDEIDPIDSDTPRPEFQRPRNEPDQWRDYAIEAEKREAAAGEIDRIADAVDEARQPAPEARPEIQAEPQAEPQTGPQTEPAAQTAPHPAPSPEPERTETPQT
jgi:cell division initiation protein